MDLNMALVFTHKPCIYPSCNLKMSLVKFTMYWLNTFLGDGKIKLLTIVEACRLWCLNVTDCGDYSERVC